MIAKIVELARVKGLTQAAIERACALSENRISKWSGGTGEPSARELYRIARLLGCSFEYLVDDAADDPSWGAAWSPPARQAAKMAEALQLTEAEVIVALNAARPPQANGRPLFGAAAPSAPEPSAPRSRRA